jgi:hypothetical protein
LRTIWTWLYRCQHFQLNFVFLIASYLFLECIGFTEDQQTVFPQGLVLPSAEEMDQHHPRVLALFEKNRTHKNISGQFVQRRQQRGLPRPLISSGDFQFSPQQGLTWYVKEPISLELLISSDNTLQRFENGTTEVWKQGRQNMNRMLLELFNLNPEDLGHRFAVQAVLISHPKETLEEKLQLNLTPKGLLTQMAINNIQLEFRNQVLQKLLLNLSEDSWVEITFTNLQREGEN